MLKVTGDDFLGTITQPGDNLNVITDETGNVTLEDCGVAYQDTFIHHVCGIGLGYHCKGENMIKEAGCDASEQI